MGNIKENYELMFTEYPDLVDVTQLKEMLNIGITLAYRLVREKIILSLKVGREYKIPKRNVIAYLTNQNWLDLNVITWYYTNNINSKLNLSCYRKGRSNNDRCNR